MTSWYWCSLKYIYCITYTQLKPTPRIHPGEIEHFGLIFWWVIKESYSMSYYHTYDTLLWHIFIAWKSASCILKFAIYISTNMSPGYAPVMGHYAHSLSFPTPESIEVWVRVGCLIVFIYQAQLKSTFNLPQLVLKCSFAPTPPHGNRTLL